MVDPHPLEPRPLFTTRAFIRCCFVLTLFTIGSSNPQTQTFLEAWVLSLRSQYTEMFKVELEGEIYISLNTLSDL